VGVFQVSLRLPVDAVKAANEAAGIIKYTLVQSHHKR
jgi:hypothetical protein